jgi:galactokinase
MHTAYAPGRVELLGNHTDYNQGYVLSAAIDRGVTLVGEATGSPSTTLHSVALEQSYETSSDRLVPNEEHEWANYPLGVLDVFQKEGLPVCGFRAEIESTLPLGAGLSSSAALEVSTAKLLEKIFGFTLDPLRLAKLCRRAENEFVGVNCGLLDQVSSVFGKAGHAIFLDCRRETVETTPFPAGVALLITHCGVAHRLSGGEYNERREQCFDAASRMGVEALRDVSSAQLEAARESLPRLSYLRAAHIVGENERVLQGVELLRAGDVKAFGALMFASHESSRVNFENSTPELDALVEIARTLPGVLGSRLTGGGFGGATVTLLESDKATAVAEALAGRYHEKTGFTAHTYLCAIADGAR